MTQRQKQLIQAEIARHVSLALLSDEPVIQRSHMEVVNALWAALAPQKGGVAKTATTVNMAAILARDYKQRVLLEFVNGMEVPPRDGAYYCKFDCDGMIICQITWWDSALGAWLFKKHGVKIDASV